MLQPVAPAASVQCGEFTLSGPVWPFGARSGLYLFPERSYGRVLRKELKRPLDRLSRLGPPIECQVSRGQGLVELEVVGVQIDAPLKSMKSLCDPARAHEQARQQLVIRRRRRPLLDRAQTIPYRCLCPLRRPLVERPLSQRLQY